MGQTAAIAAERAFMVFGCMFLLSYLAATALARVIPSGLEALLGSGLKVEGKGEDRMVDLEKQTVDLSKLQDMMR